MSKRVYLYDAIRSNHIRIALGILVFLAVVPIAIVLLILLFMPAKLTSQVTANLPEILMCTIIITSLLFILYFIFCFFACRKWLFMIFGKVELPPNELHKLEMALENVSLAAGVKTPEVEVVEMGGVNAISIPGGSNIVISKRAFKELDRWELEALLAHEYFHIMSHDNWLWVLGFGIGFFIPIFYDLGYELTGVDARWKRLLFKLLNTLGFIFLCIVCLIPFGFFFIPMFVFTLAFFFFILPKQREYLADAEAVLITRNPEAVIGAIEKSEDMRIEALDWYGPVYNHMLFNRPQVPNNPLNRSLENSINIHPDAQDRVDRIRAMG